MNKNLKAVAQQSEELGILTPFTSAIIVETTTQEKVMSLAELQALNAKSALAFKEGESRTNMPEPPLWCYLLLLPFLFFRKKIIPIFSKLFACGKKF